MRSDAIQVLWLPSHQAQHLANERRKPKVKARIDDDAWIIVKQLNKLDRNPEQIRLWLKVFNTTSISHEWIYQFILQDKSHGGDLHHHLRCQKQRRKRYGSYNRHGQLVDRICIDERPAECKARFTLIQKVIAGLPSVFLMP